MREAKKYMHHKTMHGVPPTDNEVTSEQCWTVSQVEEHVRNNPTRCIVLINDLVVDATAYLGEHVSPLSASFLN